VSRYWDFGLVESRQDEGIVTNLADKVAKDLDYQTPESILEPVRKFFGGPIPLDPATTADNPTKASRFFTPTEDGLAQSWAGDGVFVNVPYGRSVKNWCQKICLEAEPCPLQLLKENGLYSGIAPVTIIALLPGGSRTETKYWQEFIFNPHLNVVCYIRRRVAFIRPSTGLPAKSNTYGSALFGYNVNVNRFVETFKHLGRCIKMTRMA
jgi:site-specific DNA-methyltransferase (adenine-specific)